MSAQQSNIKPKQVIESAEPMVIAGLSREYLFGKPMDPSGQWQQLGRYLGNIPGQKGNAAFGLCFDLDGGKGIEYVCGMEISDNGKLPEGFIRKELPSLDYAVFDHKGHISGIRQTCDAIWQEWIPVSGYNKPDEADFFFERYGEGFDPKKGIGDIEIWVPVEA